MGLRKALAHTVMHLSRWTFAPEFPLPDRCLVIGAPHTSNWDGFYMVMAMWAVERPVSFLVKKNLTDVPVIGSFVKAIGGIPVDREHPGHLVEHIISLAESKDHFVLASMARSVATGGVSRCDSLAIAVTTWTKSAISTVGWWGFAQKTPASRGCATKTLKTKIPEIFALKSVL